VCDEILSAGSILRHVRADLQGFFSLSLRLSKDTKSPQTPKHAVGLRASVLTSERSRRQGRGV
jgi:hypothetical protein